jgi:hypothetical protein
VTLQIFYLMSIINPSSPISRAIDPKSTDEIGGAVNYRRNTVENCHQYAYSRQAPLLDWVQRALAEVGLAGWMRESAMPSLVGVVDCV